MLDAGDPRSNAAADLLRHRRRLDSRSKGADTVSERSPGRWVATLPPGVARVEVGGQPGGSLTRGMGQVAE